MPTLTELNIGPIRPTPKGIWSATQAYNYLDIVKDTTASYIAISVTGVPAGTPTTDTAYWQCLVTDGQDTTSFSFATESEYQNQNANKPINSALIKPKLTSIDTLITTLTAVVNTLEAKFTPEGQVNDAAKLGGKAPNHYDCGGGCSWTCGKGCTGSCNNSCTGTCMAGCTGGCSSCTGTCVGTCSSSCTGSCTGGCTASCSNACGGCAGRTH